MDENVVVELMARQARACDGAEVPRDMWPTAELVVAKYPDEFHFDGPARGPDKMWKRLEVIAKENNDG